MSRLHLYLFTSPAVWGEHPKGRKRPGVFAAGMGSGKMRGYFIQDGVGHECTSPCESLILSADY
jgi:hypothetical protein